MRLIFKKKTHTHSSNFRYSSWPFFKLLISKKIIYSKNKNTSRTGGGGGKRAYIKTPWISFFPRKTSLLVHTFMCISRSWLFFRVYKRANALLIKILIQKLSFYKSNHFLTHNLDFWIKLLTIFQTVDLFNKIITAKTLQNFFWFSNCEVRTLQTPTNTWNCYGYWLDERLIKHMKKKRSRLQFPVAQAFFSHAKKSLLVFLIF